MHDKRMLIIGGGFDPIAGHFAESGADVTVVELSHSDVVSAARRNPAVRYIQADAHWLPTRQKFFDMTWSVSTLQYMSYADVIVQCRDSLRPGGVSIFVENLRGNPAAQLDRWRRRMLGVTEPPTMRIRRHVSLCDLDLFKAHYSRVVVRVWHDWSTLLMPLLNPSLPGSRIIARAVRAMAKPLDPAAWRARWGWVLEIAAFA